ncbi:MAG: hypothetical protein ABIJ34_02140 [archaeon]
MTTKSIVAILISIQIVLLFIAGTLLQKNTELMIKDITVLSAKKEELILMEKNLLAQSMNLNATIEAEKTNVTNLNSELSDITGKKQAVIVQQVQPAPPPPPKPAPKPVVTRAS